MDGPLVATGGHVQLWGRSVGAHHEERGDGSRQLAAAAGARGVSAGSGRPAARLHTGAQCNIRGAVADPAVTAYGIRHGPGAGALTAAWTRVARSANVQKDYAFHDCAA